MVLSRRKLWIYPSSLRSPEKKMLCPITTNSQPDTPTPHRTAPPPKDILLIFVNINFWSMHTRNICRLASNSQLCQFRNIFRWDWFVVFCQCMFRITPLPIIVINLILKQRRLIDSIIQQFSFQSFFIQFNSSMHSVELSLLIPMYPYYTC